jgi:hypothetical protein
LLLALAALLFACRPADAGELNLAVCAVVASSEGRLVMEQSSASGDCSRPSHTRVFDRFLGFTCIDGATETASCRSYWPAEGSRIYDTSRHYRCIDVAVSASEEGTWVNRMRMWIAPQPKACEWTPHLQILAMEFDFDNGEVCVASFCLRTDHLTAVGKFRLRRLVAQALRELGLMGEDETQTAVLMAHQILKPPPAR